MKGFILALDQGTTSSRAILFDRNGAIVSMAQYPFRQMYPKPGYVEHDPEEILATQFRAMWDCVEKSGIAPEKIDGIGITNQRETVVVWEKASGKPVYPAIVWQCRRTAALCEKLKEEGLEDMIRSKTGLRIDAYFTATKLQWILDEVPGVRARAEAGELLCGTIDSFLIWRMTKGAVHVSDYSNCSRTMLFDIHSLQWDAELCQLLHIPMHILPRPVPNSMKYGTVATGVSGIERLSGVPICGAAGDQQAALFGQACFEHGHIKNTYGTGCFTLMNTGGVPICSQHNLLTSIGWYLNGEITYVLEGSVFNAGSAIQWLRDELGVIRESHECDVLAESVEDSGGVYMVPAFTGLGAPYWDMYARGTIVGLTRGTTRAHLCRAVLEGIAFQTADLIRAMEKDAGSPIPALQVDGGASVSDIMMQFQSDLLQIPVERPSMIETSAWGAASFAGLTAGLWSDLSELKQVRSLEKTFTPQRNRREEFPRWEKAIQKAMHWETP